MMPMTGQQEEDVAKSGGSCRSLPMQMRKGMGDFERDAGHVPMTIKEGVGVARKTAVICRSPG